MSKRLPVTIITGFLGSGKTTVLRHLLEFGKKRLAVIINEFGTVGLDGDLLKTCGFCSEEDLENRLVELNNGCLCCTVQDDFLPTMQTLLSRSNELDGIVVETSGLALPRPLLQALEWPAIRSKVHLNGVVTIVDGEALNEGSPVGDKSALEKQRKQDDNLDHLTPLDELFTDQLEVADLVLISRADCISLESILNVKNRISPKVKRGTPILSVSNGMIESSIVLGLDHANTSEPFVDHVHSEDHHHLQVQSETVRLESDFDRNEIEQILPDLAIRYQIIRLKGRCWLKGKKIPLQVQMVGSRLNTWYEGVPNSAWKPQTTGLDFVVLSFQEGASSAIVEAFQH
tara:strand:+ start:1106 stop:2137 length:1032 start_codon:yes stop_codon:yes gene_type:complete